MKKFTIVLFLLAFTTIVFAAPIDFDNLHVASTAFGQAAYEHNPRLMAAYDNKIYFILSDDGSANPSKVYSYDPSDGLSNTANHSIIAETTDRFVVLRQANNLLYFADNLGNVYSYDGITLSEMSGTPFTASDYVRSIETFGALVFFGTSEGDIFRYNGVNFEQVFDTDGARYIVDMAAWQKDGYLYVSVSSIQVCCPATAYVMRSNSGDVGSWETVFQGGWNTSLLMPTTDYLYTGIIDSAYGFWSSVRKSSDGLSFPAINQSSGQYKKLLDSLYYDGIAYVFVNQWGGGFGYQVIDENGTVSLVENQNWTVTQAVELNGEVYALASSAPYDYYGGLGPADVYLITTAPEPALGVTVDIKPGSCPNPLRVNFIGSGVFPVVIVGSEDFDVLDINVDTITLAGVAPLRSKVGDVSTAGGVCELGPDGIADLVLKFERQAVLDALEDLYGDITEIPNREELFLTLLAETYEGEPVTGTDSLVVLNRGAIKRKKK